MKHKKRPNYYRPPNAPNWVRALELAGNLPDAHDPAAVPVLVEKFQAGDESVREPLVLGYLKLVAEHAMNAAMRHGTRRPPPVQEDLFLSGCEGLLMGVDGLKRKHESPNFVGYLAEWIDGAIHRWVWPDDGEEDALSLVKAQWPKWLKPEAPDMRKVVEVWDQVEACCQSVLDLAVVRLHWEGHTWREIGKMLNVAPNTARSRFYAVEARYFERWGTPTVAIPKAA
jgi:hypothetical protein